MFFPFASAWQLPPVQTLAKTRAKLLVQLTSLSLEILNKALRDATLHIFFVQSSMQSVIVRIKNVYDYTPRNFILICDVTIFGTIQSFP